METPILSYTVMIAYIRRHPIIYHPKKSLIANSSNAAFQTGPKDIPVNSHIESGCLPQKTIHI